MKSGSTRLLVSFCAAAVFRHQRGTRTCWRQALFCILILHFGSAGAEYSEQEASQHQPPPPDGAHIVDGSFVMNAGELQINVTNFGLIGSQFTIPTTYCNAPSGQWPSGSGDEYLWAAGLWIGGKVQGVSRVTTGMFESEFRPSSNIEDTMYEAIDGEILRPPGFTGLRGRRQYEYGHDDDNDGLVDEDGLNGFDDEGDGLVDEDFGQISNQMFVCTMYDNTMLTAEIYPDHQAMGLRIVQNTYAWNEEVADDFVAFEYKITNIGNQTIEDVYLGILVDCDIGRRDRPDAGIDDRASHYTGFVRSSNGMYNPVRMGYMFDGAEEDPLPGYFGVAIVGHPVDYDAIVAPKFVTLRSFQVFSSLTAYDQGGYPTNDEERYHALSQDTQDEEIPPEEANDYRFLLSCGPFDELAPHETFTFQFVFVAGNGLEELKEHAAEAGQVLFGNWVDYDGSPYSGTYGRETKMCAEYMDTQLSWSNPNHPIYGKSKYFWDTSCMPPLTWMPDIRPWQLREDAEGNHCLMVNFDNCDECLRRSGMICTRENYGMFRGWNCISGGLSAEARAGCTGVAGRESEMKWSAGGWPPPPPNIRIWPRDHVVHVYWDNRSESIPDPNSNLYDFESYVVWRSDEWDRSPGTSLDYGPAHPTWQTVAEFDVVNSFHDYYPTNPGDFVHSEQSLGQNTGLAHIAYTPACLSDERFSGLDVVMQAFVDADSEGSFFDFPLLTESYLEDYQNLEAFRPWMEYSAELDTFFAVATRLGDFDQGIVPKVPIRYYEFIDHSVHNGFVYFYSVTATDHAFDTFGGSRYISGYGREGMPNTSFEPVTPGFDAQTLADRKINGANIYVFPNPASVDALAEYQQMSPSFEDPSGVRVTFANLPLAHNTIRIYTLAGDLVQTLEHDGTGGFGQISWNLVSRNRQQIISGIYMYAVTSDDDRFDDFIGKFVVIR